MYETYCNILGVKPGASPEEIKHAFHEKAMLSHPDLNPSLSSYEFIRVKKAFDYLMNRVVSSEAGNNSRFTYSFVRKKRYEKPDSFDWESYRNWQENIYQKQHPPKKDIDFKSTLFGKIVYYSFHLLFLIIGLYIIITPTLSVIIDGIDKDQNVITAIISVAGASIFGIIMVVMIVLSGLSVNIFKKA